MGTRADFYVGRGASAEWLGSIAWDGYPTGHPKDCFGLTSEADFRKWVEVLISTREDGTKPEQGWPWPWDNSQTTDYAYAFDGGKVWASGFGHAWFDPLQPEPESEESGRKVEFPDMKSKQKVTMGERSGLIVFGLPQ